MCQAKYCFHTCFFICTYRIFPFRHAAVVSWFALRSSYFISVNDISTLSWVSVLFELKVEYYKTCNWFSDKVKHIRLYPIQLTTCQCPSLTLMVMGADCICTSKLPYTTNDMESPLPVDIMHTNCMIYVITYMAIVLTSFFRQPVKDTMNHNKNGQCPNIRIWTASCKSGDAQHTCYCPVVFIRTAIYRNSDSQIHNVHDWCLIWTARYANSDSQMYMAIVYGYCIRITNYRNNDS